MKGARNMQAAAVRLPEDLMQWLKHQAVDNHRSLAGEVNFRLEESRREQLRREEAVRNAIPGAQQMVRVA